MKDSVEVQISKFVRSEVGTLEGAADALVLRLEQMPLADDDPSPKPTVSVFILDRTAADNLQQQLVQALGRMKTNAFRIDH